MCQKVPLADSLLTRDEVLRFERSEIKADP